MKIRELKIENIVIGTGAAGFQAALRLYQNGERDLAILAEDVNAGTSRNTGSDKQTYYKLSLASGDLDSVRTMAEDLFAGQCVGALRGRSVIPELFPSDRAWRAFSLYRIWGIYGI